jgi:predicted DNA-binding protein YlxM (UPF0122 family)
MTKLNKKIKSRTYPVPHIDVAEALKLRYQNKLSLGEIARHYNVTVSAVSRRLSKFQKMILEPAELDTFREQEVNIMRTVRFKILEQMNNAKKLKDASINNLAYAQSNLFRDESILSGRPTDISNSLQITASLEQIEKRKMDLLRQIDAKLASVSTTYDKNTTSCVAYNNHTTDCENNAT